MNDMFNTGLDALITSSIKDSRTIKAVAHAVDNQLKEVSNHIIDTVLLPRIDSLPEEIVDTLAWQFHVDYYEPLGGLDLNKKRLLVKNSLKWHRLKGTKSAVNEIIQTLFTDGFRVEEWFEYGGEPAYFRILIDGFLEQGQAFGDLIRAVYEFKNLRSWLERIILQREAESTLYFGSIAKHEKKISVPSEYGHTAKPAELYLGSILKRTKITSSAPGYGHTAEANQLHFGAAAVHTRKRNIPSSYGYASLNAGLYTGVAIRCIKKLYIKPAGS